jgi:hypothetical protein
MSPESFRYTDAEVARSVSYICWSVSRGAKTVSSS